MSMVIPDRIERKYEPYPDYKDSDVEWLRQIPPHWEIKKIKWDTPVFRGASPRPIDDPIYFDDEGEYAWVRIADVTASETYLEKTTQQLSELGASLSVKMEPGKLFLSIAGSVGKPCITKIKCCIHDGFVYFPRLTCDTKFLYYIFASGEPYKGLGKLGTQLNLNTDTVASIYIGFPPSEEQQAIADYLDCETTRIDDMIARKQRLIELLQERRSALITHTVTKGLNPDAPMKDSGVEWLGDIPAHWEIKRFRFLFSLSKGKNPEVLIQFELDNAQPYVTMNYIRTGLLESYGYPNHNTLMVDDGDLALLWDGSKSGEFVLCRQGILGSTLTKCNHTRVIDRRFAYYACKTIERHLQAMTIGMGIPHVDRDSLNNMLLPLLKINEQQCIADYLDQKTARIDNLVSKINQAIEKLQEYRSALITAAVTGKIDVRQHVS